MTNEDLDALALMDCLTMGSKSNGAALDFMEALMDCSTELIALARSSQEAEKRGRIAGLREAMEIVNIHQCYRHDFYYGGYVRVQDVGMAVESRICELEAPMRDSHLGTESEFLDGVEVGAYDGFRAGYIAALRNVAIGLSFDCELMRRGFNTAMTKTFQESALLALASLGDEDAKRIVGGAL